MANIIRELFTNWIYLPFLSLLKFLESDIVWFYVLIVIFIVSVSIKGKINKRNLIESKNNEQNQSEPKKEDQSKKRNKLFPKVIDAISVISIILLLIVGYARFEPQIKNFFKTDVSPQTPSTPTTTPSTKTNPNTQTAPTQQTVPTYQAPKQLYYAISCYSCWAEGCSRNGYSYSGYDAYYYTYYTALCKSCSCNSLTGRSFWK